MNKEQQNRLIWVERQEKTFKAISDLQYKVRSLASYVQNDFARMLEDGTTTKETIRNKAVQMDEYCNLFIDELNQLRDKAQDIMDHYSK